MIAESRYSQAKRMPNSVLLLQLHLGNCCYGLTAAGLLPRSVTKVPTVLLYLPFQRRQGRWRFPPCRSARSPKWPAASAGKQRCRTNAMQVRHLCTFIKMASCKNNQTMWWRKRCVCQMLIQTCIYVLRIKRCSCCI